MRDILPRTERGKSIVSLTVLVLVIFVIAACGVAIKHAQADTQSNQYTLDQLTRRMVLAEEKQAKALEGILKELRKMKR